MSSRSRAAWDLHRRLEMETGVPVEVSWDKSATSRGWAWHVNWSDGPTRPAMRALAERVLREIGGLEADRLYYSRIVQRRALALAMIRNVRLGQPPLGRWSHVSGLELELDDANYPEQGSDEDKSLAERLGQLSDWLEHRMVEILETRGLAALDEPPAADNVIPLHRYRNKT